MTCYNANCGNVSVLVYTVKVERPGDMNCWSLLFEGFGDALFVGSTLAATTHSKARYARSAVTDVRGYKPI